MSTLSNSSNSTSLYGDAGTPIPDSSGDVIVRGTLTVNGCAILTNCSSFSFLPLNATSIGIGASATSISIGAGSGTTTINNQLATDNYSFPVADGTANQVLTTNGAGVLSFADVGSLDTNYNIQADPVVGGANLTLAGSDATTDSVKFASAGGTTVSRTDASTITISSADTNTTYTQDASVAVGGANLNLVGSDSTTDTIKFANGGHITATATSAGIITLGSDATNANTASTIVSRDASGNFSAGTGSFAGVIFNGSTSGSVTVAAPAVAGSQSYTLPTAVPALSGYVLSSTTGGVLSWVANPDVDTTYDFNATSTSGGANLNLVGSDATTDTVKLSNGTGVGIAQVSGTEVIIGIGQPVAVTDTPTFTGLTIIPPQPSLGGSSTFNQPTSTSTNISYNLPNGQGAVSTVLTNDGSGNLTWALPGGGGSTFGNVTVGVDSDQTISTTSGNLVLQTAAGVNAGTITMASGVNGDITLAPNGTGSVILSDDSYVLGQLAATRNAAYVIPPQNLTTLAGSNGIVVASSSGGLGYGANIAIRYYSGDTTAGTNNAAALNFSGASGTNSVPGGNFANQVLGSSAYDAYTAGTSNNFATAIATANQGAGTTGIAPLQAQGYARQAFTNSVILTTAVTGASGTGTTATLTFTLQNTAPYAVGQTVTIAGMTPSGYNGTVVITASTTSSISYANATTGFTSGGTIAAANTVTAAGTGFRVRGFANSTNMTAGNRFNFMDLTASTANFKSAAYTFANDVITGSTLTATNYMTLGSTGATITTGGLSTVTRTTVGIPTVAENRPSMNIQLTRSDQATPNDNDGTSFRTRVAGSNGTFYTVSDINSTYRTGGDVQFNLNLANGDQTTSTFSSLNVLSGSITKTVIRAGTASGTPGASSVSDILTVEPAKITAAVPIQFPSYTVAAAGAITGAAGWQISISNSTGNGGRMAYWDTTNARWNYVSDDTAI